VKLREIASYQSNRKVVILLLLGLFALAFSLGKMGIDFGEHWDQRKIVKTVIRTYEEAILLPGWYNYPSLTYSLLLAASLPDSFSALIGEGNDITSQLVGFRHDVEDILGASEYVRESLQSGEFPLRARLFFLFVTLLTGWWVYLLARQMGVNRWASLFAAALFFSSWEIGYHARWIAPDGLLMQFGTLTLLLVMLALSSSGYRPLVWLALSAVAAGLTCGAKYYGGMLLLPVLLGGYAFLRTQKQTWREMFVLSLGLVAIFTASFLLSTPGAIVDPLRFLKHVNFEIYHYNTGHFGYTVTAGLEHFWLYISYLVLVAFSPYPPLAVLVIFMSLVGVYAMVKQRASWWQVLVFLSIPLLHVAYMSQQKVLFVRNYLIIMPLVAILAGQGLAFLWNLRRLNAPANRLVLTVLSIGLLTVNFAWQYTAAQSVQRREGVDLPAHLAETIQSSPNKIFYLSPQAQELAGHLSFPNVVSEPQRAGFFLYLSKENGKPLANRFGMYQTPYGPYEVNFNYYPSWDGDSRLVVMNMEDALAQKHFRDLMQGQP
jgi:hypothetical protein